MSHSHHHCCSESASEDDTELGIQYSLYSKILIDDVECLNEEEEGSGKLVFKPWEQRLEFDKFVQSDVDEELLFNIPFAGNVKLKGIIIIGGEGNTHPSKMKIYKNRSRLTFDDVTGEADEQYELHPDLTGSVEYPLKAVKFSSVQNLSLYFPNNFGDEKTIVYYIGLRGEFTSAFQQEVAICSYESAPNPVDHKIRSFGVLPQEIR